MKQALKPEVEYGHLQGPRKAIQYVEKTVCGCWSGLMAVGLRRQDQVLVSLVLPLSWRRSLLVVASFALHSDSKGGRTGFRSLLWVESLLVWRAIRRGREADQVLVAPSRLSALCESGVLSQALFGGESLGLQSHGNYDHLWSPRRAIAAACSTRKPHFG